MSPRQTKIFIVLDGAQPLVAFRTQSSAMDFCHTANEASRRAATSDPKQPPRWHTFTELELRTTPSQGKL